MAEIAEYLKSGEIIIPTDNSLLEYSGRIGRTADGDVEMTFACSYVKFHFKGASAAILVTCEKYYWDAFYGLIVDGTQTKGVMKPGEINRIDIVCEGDCEHVVTFFKRQDACNLFILHGIVIDEKAVLMPLPAKPGRRIEVYGDSVSAGEVSEAVDFVAKSDPEGHNGAFSNCWYSYSWMTARRLNAELHDIAQGGVALLEGTGWFSGPDYVGMEQIYDKVKYYPDLEHATSWDFSKFIPHVVVVAIGQNDANPRDYMKEDYDGPEADNWRRHYAEFIKKLRELYPKAYIICQTTLLMHDEAWDRAIESAVTAVGDDRVKHFTYRLNGKGTPGHLRIPEAEMMAEELSTYIESLPGVWED